MKIQYPKHVPDHFLTGEEFTLTRDPEHGYLKTEPQPSPETIAKYYDSPDYFSHDDEAKGFMASIYRTVKGINLRSKKNLLSKFQPAYQTVLDIGCGTGEFLKILPDTKRKTGTEINPKAADQARRKDLNILPTLEQVTQKYDVITLWHVLEHLYDLPGTLDQINERLADGGLLIIAVPNYKSYDAQYYQSQWAAYDVPRHLWHFDKASITSLMESQNLEVVKILPMYWDSYYVSLLSEKYRNSFLQPARALTIGTISNLKALFTKEHSSLIYLIRKNDDK